MTIRVLGAGLGRTGTLSLKVEIERLLGEPCYHMVDIFPIPSIYQSGTSQRVAYYRIGMSCE